MLIDLTAEQTEKLDSLMEFSGACEFCRSLMTAGDDKALMAQCGSKYSKHPGKFAAVPICVPCFQAIRNTIELLKKSPS